MVNVNYVHMLIMIKVICYMMVWIIFGLLIVNIQQIMFMEGKDMGMIVITDRLSAFC